MSRTCREDMTRTHYTSWPEKDIGNHIYLRIRQILDVLFNGFRYLHLQHRPGAYLPPIAFRGWKGREHHSLVGKLLVTQSTLRKFVMYMEGTLYP
jgi:hypothetical protein